VRIIEAIAAAARGLVEWCATIPLNAPRAKRDRLAPENGLTDFREQLGDPDLVRFYELWTALRGNRAMPSRKDLDPLQIGTEFLPNLMLIDVLREPRRYRYRLIGTHVVTASGEDRTGRMFENVGFFKVHPVVVEQYERVVDTGQPLHSLEPFMNFRSGSTYEVDRLLLPLSSDGRTVDMLVVLFHFKTGPFARSLGKPRSAKKLPSGR
jgi:hypothetical protein